MQAQRTHTHTHMRQTNCINKYDYSGTLESPKRHHVTHSSIHLVWFLADPNEMNRESYNNSSSQCAKCMFANVNCNVGRFLFLIPVTPQC